MIKALSNRECTGWLHSHGIPVGTGPNPDLAIGDLEILFESPRESRQQAIIARTLTRWVGAFDSALLWLTDWPFYQPDEMALVDAVRRGHGERRPLIESPGHVFEADDQAELTGWLSLMQAFGWDSHLFTSPSTGSVVHTSHHDVLWVTTSDRGRFDEIHQAVSAAKLTIHRKSA